MGKKYDENNNLIYYTNSDGIKQEWFYDERNNLISYIDDDYEWKKVYDENNNLIHYTNSKGVEISYTVTISEVTTIV